MNFSSNTGNLGFFLLINLNIIIVMVLAFLVVKNIVKLVLDRRRNIFGARLRTRLVAAFVGLSLIPTALLFFVARGILDNVLQGWFSPQVVAAVDGSVKVARFYYESRERELKTKSLELAATAKRAGAAASTSDWLEQKRREHGLVELALLTRAGEVLKVARDQKLLRRLKSLPQINLPELSGRDAEVRAEQSLEHEFLRAYAPLNGSRVLLATVWISPRLNRALAKVVSAFDDYKELSSYQRPLASTYLLTLVVVTLMVVFAAIWVGFYLARGLSGPIQQLAEGTEQVAHGNLEFQLPEASDDELGVLVHSFNLMTDDLRRTRDELVARRRYMETLLANVGVGVVSLDSAGQVQTVNTSAREMLGLAGADAARVNPEDVFGAELAGELRQRLSELHASGERLLTFNSSRTAGDRTLHLQITLTKLLDDAGELMGAVLLLDDLTELVSAQRMAAWREVARRIAHEIKNPLTPIQLSAQRMLRRFSEERAANLSAEQRELIQESNQVIVQQVDILRTLVNEFSRFARMPKSNPRPTDLNALLADVVRMFEQAHPKIRFVLESDPTLPLVALDPDQLNRVLVNLLDNAVLAVSGPEADSGFAPEIRLRSHYQADLDLAAVSVADNGHGIPDADKAKLFEPYFSTRKGGTGLGLAIVRSIVADHQGVIRVRDNNPRGAVFTLEMPVDTEQRMGS